MYPSKNVNGYYLITFKPEVMLLSPYNLRHTSLNNRVVMAPMTRNRAINNMPNNLMVDYYKQRASAGLIITEGVSPSPNGYGYPRVPGLFNQAQLKAWKNVTYAVKEKGGKIFMQLMHTGRVSHSYNLPTGVRIIAPSAVPMRGTIWTDKDGFQSYEHPVPMDQQDIIDIKKDFVQASRWALEAGFDGVELHAASGYLLEQFISPQTNQRDDQYGGTIANRSRLILEIIEELKEAVGAERVGIKISPYGTSNGMTIYDDIDATYFHLAERFDEIGIAYLHVSDESGNIPTHFRTTVRSVFSNTLILSGGYTHGTAEDALESGHADLIAFGKPFIANPDLVERFNKHFPLNFKLDASKFYSPGARGFTDYPVFAEEFVSSW
ncbi:MAG: alkene reductase [Chryseolinea sp.]